MTVLEKLLFNLHTLAAVPKGKRINTTKEFINIEDDSVMQGLWRWKNADSRDKTIKCISKEIHTTIMITAYILDSKYLDSANPATSTTSGAPDTILPTSASCPARSARIAELKKIRMALFMASTGVNNICQTYENDSDFAGRLRPLLGEIVICTASISSALARLGETTDMGLVLNT